VIIFTSVQDTLKRRANGTRFSRREASAASEAVGWKRWLASVLERKF